MRKHPKAGQKIIIKNGVLKGRSFLVVDYLTTQYQGKDIKRIKANHLTQTMVNRGHPLDDNTVFGQFFPGMEYGCVHDSELRLQVIEGVNKVDEVASKTTDAGSNPATPANVSPIKKGNRRKKNETETT